MRRTRIAALAAAGALAATGSGVALATSLSDDAKEREQALLDDAAERLDVEPSELREALRAAQDEQLDADVKAGRLTQEQADAIKEMRERSGLVLGGPGAGIHRFSDGPRGERGFHVAGPLPLIDGAAEALGLDREELFERLHDGDTLAEIAEAEGKDYDDVKAAIRAEVKERLDRAVEAGRLPRAVADDILEHLTADLEDGRLGPERPALPFLHKDGDAAVAPPPASVEPALAPPPTPADPA